MRLSEHVTLVCGLADVSALKETFGFGPQLQLQLGFCRVHEELYGTTCLVFTSELDVPATQINQPSDLGGVGEERHAHEPTTA